MGAKSARSLRRSKPAAELSVTGSLKTSMDIHRRIEITAFRHRILLASDGTLEKSGVMIEENELVDVDTASSDGQRILLEAVRLLSEKLIKPETGGNQ